MPILCDIPVALTAEQILATRGRRRIQPGLIHDAGEAITLGQELWRPAAVYEWFDVADVDGEKVWLAANAGGGREAVLHVGPRADLLAGTQRALAAVGTLGAALETRVHELQAGSEPLQSFLLDSAGVVALGAVGEALRCLAEEAAAREGWGVSPAVSPGSLVGWPLQGQRELCNLLPLDEIGVRLNEHYVLQPHKSFSALIGIGPALVATRVGSVCKYCALQDTCWRRREDPS